MTWSAVPDGELWIGGMRVPGRRLFDGSGVPVTWVSDKAVGSAGAGNSGGQ